MLGIENFVSRENREVDVSKPVQVYRNLNNGKISIKQGGLVVGYCDKIYLKEVEMRVSERGRQRVLLTKNKNVHATLQGKINEKLIEGENEMRYNPYLYPTFISIPSMESVYKSEVATVNSEGKMSYK